LLRPAKRPKGVEIRAFLRRLVRAIRSHWPQVEILVRADSHYACPEVLDWCAANGLDYGLAPTRTLRRHIVGLEARTAARFKAAPGDGKIRRLPLRVHFVHKEFFDAAGSCSRVRRIVARVEAGDQGTDTRLMLRIRFAHIVTNLGHGRGRSLYQDLYCRRGQAENHIKAWTTHLAADRTSCPKATANQFRLFLHAGAYWLLSSLRALMPRRSSWRVAQFDTLRLRLIKIAARIVEMKIRIKIHLPTSTPDPAIWHLALGRLPRLLT
jgi:Transposase DDE domain group 1